MQKSSAHRHAVWPILLVIIGIACVIIPINTLYKNIKKDNIDGRGVLLLTEDCRHIGPWDGDYECKGTWRQNTGMIELPDATARVTGRYFKGEQVQDIYRDTLISLDLPASQQHFISGEERRSLLHNLPLLAAMLGGVGFIVWALKGFREIRAQQK